VHKTPTGKAAGQTSQKQFSSSSRFIYFVKVLIDNVFSKKKARLHRWKHKYAGSSQRTDAATQKNPPKSLRRGKKMPRYGAKQSATQKKTCKFLRRGNRTALCLGFFLTRSGAEEELEIVGVVDLGLVAHASHIIQNSVS